MVPYGTIWYHMVPYGTIWYPYGTICYHMVPYGTIWYLMVPYGTIWGHPIRDGRSNVRPLKKEEGKKHGGYEKLCWNQQFMQKGLFLRSCWDHVGVIGHAGAPWLPWQIMLESGNQGKNTSLWDHNGMMWGPSLLYSSSWANKNLCVGQIGFRGLDLSNKRGFVMARQKVASLLQRVQGPALLLDPGPLPRCKVETTSIAIPRLETAETTGLVATIIRYMVPYGTKWYYMVPYGTLWYHMVPYGTIRYHMVP